MSLLSRDPEESPVRLAVEMDCGAASRLDLNASAAVFPTPDLDDPMGLVNGNVAATDRRRTLECYVLEPDRKAEARGDSKNWIELSIHNKGG